MNRNIRPEKFFKKYPGVVALASLRGHGNMKFTEYKEGEANREFFRDRFLDPNSKLVLADVDHGSSVTTIYSKNFQHFEKVVKTDALIASNIKNLHLGITFADCPFVFLLDPVEKIYAVVHCGWKPVVGGILYNVFNKILKMGSNPKNIRASIGPGICQKCYEFGKKDADIFFRLYREFIHNSRKPGKCHIDLKGIIKYQLVEELSISRSNTEISNDCTCCDKDIYFSYRGEKMDPEYVKAGIALIGLRKIKNLPA